MNTGDGLDALLTILANLARPQAPALAPETQSDLARSRSESDRSQGQNGSRDSLGDWWRAIDSDEHYQALWERSQEWNEDSRDPQEFK